MKISDLIRHFMAVESVPLDIEDDIVPVLRDNGVKDDFFVFEVEMDDASLRGKLVHWEPWEYPTGPGRDDTVVCVADIYIAKSLPPEWKRLVACKELLHVLDSEECRVYKPDDIDNLIRRIGLPIEAQDPIADGTQVQSDRMAIYEAVAVLFPMAVRNLLMPAYKADKLTIDDIASLIDIPPRYVWVVMHEVWDRAHADFAGLGGKD